MIRRDFFLRMIEEFAGKLAKAIALRQGGQLAEAEDELDEEFRHLIGSGAETVADLSETELLARLLQGDATHLIREKTLMLATLLKEAGEVSLAQGNTAQARVRHLKGLHLLLGAVQGENILESPAFVPSMDAFVTALSDALLPLRTLALLMQHYERTGQFAKAEDTLYAMLEQEPDNTMLHQFGLTFYQRLQVQTDDALITGGLPRAEVDAGLDELRQRLVSPSDNA